MTRLALVRGPFLNPYDMGPYRRLDPSLEPVAIAARRCFTESEGTGLPVRRLRCVETELGLRWARQINWGAWFLGQGYRLVGLDAALADADIIGTAERYFGFSAQAARAARRRNRPLVVAVKETISHIEAIHPVRRHGREASVKALVDSVASLYVAISHAAAAALRNEGIAAERIAVVHPAVDTEAFDCPERRPGRELRVLFVGPLLWRKGLFEAIQGVAVAGRHIPVRLTLVGRHGPDVRAAMSLAERIGIADRIRTLDVLAHAEMPRLYGDHDLLLSPSIPTRTWQEQDSMAVVEAMASGMVVVATPGGIRRELLGDEAYWVTPGDAGEVAERLLEVAADPNEATRRAAVQRARARAEHDHAVAARALSELYRSVLR